MWYVFLLIFFIIVCGVIAIFFFRVIAKDIGQRNETKKERLSKIERNENRINVLYTLLGTYEQTHIINHATTGLPEIPQHKIISTKELSGGGSLTTMITTIESKVLDDIDSKIKSMQESRSTNG